MDTMGENLLKQLECPLCLNIMEPPITLCASGHNICSICKPKLENCPICRGELLNVRNIYAESVSATIKHPCKYDKSGCKHVFGGDTLRQVHEDICRFGPHKCPLNVVNECDWEGPCTEMKIHIENSHAENIRMIADGKKKSYMVHYNDSPSDSYWYLFLFTMGEIFFQYSKISGNNLYMSVMYVGSREDDNKYKFKIRIKTMDGKERVLAILKCPHYLGFIDGKLSNEEFVVVSKDFTMKCVNEEGSLPYMYEIVRY